LIVQGGELLTCDCGVLTDNQCFAVDRTTFARAASPHHRCERLVTPTPVQVPTQVPRYADFRGQTTSYIMHVPGTRLREKDWLTVLPKDGSPSWEMPIPDVSRAGFLFDESDANRVVLQSTKGVARLDLKYRTLAFFDPLLRHGVRVGPYVLATRGRDVLVYSLDTMALHRYIRDFMPPGADETQNIIRALWIDQDRVIALSRSGQLAQVASLSDVLATSQ
jgi:hypothetical protein